MGISTGALLGYEHFRVDDQVDHAQNGSGCKESPRLNSLNCR